MDKLLGLLQRCDRVAYHLRSVACSLLRPAEQAYSVVLLQICHRPVKGGTVTRQVIIVFDGLDFLPLIVQELSSLDICGDPHSRDTSCASHIGKVNLGS